MLEIVLTREDANTEFALLSEWLVADGEPVRKHDVVCVVETTKASLEVESPGEGTLVHLYAAGVEVELGERIALVAETADELASARQGLEERAAAEPPAPAPTQRKATRKAVELAALHGIDLDAISKQGFITEKDVEALIAAPVGAGAAVAEAPALGGVDPRGVSLPAVYSLDESVGVLGKAFFDFLRSDPEGFRALPTGEKTATYREHGAQIGEGVVLDDAVIMAPRIVIGDGVRIGAGGTVVCEEVFAIGAGSEFGAGLELRCRRAFLGEGIWAGRSIRIGGGGHRDPWATLTIGDLAFIGDEAFVNPCRPVLIGREAFLTMRSILVTHNVGHSVLEGFENRFAPIVLEDRSQVGLGTVVYAGCRIGKEAIVASNSYVVSDVPPGKLAIGVPAKVAGEARHTPSRGRQVELARRMLEELRELLELRGHAVTPLDDGLEVEGADTKGRVLFVERLKSAVDAGEGETVVLTLDAAAVPDGVFVLDLLGRVAHGPGGVLADSVREFCRKRGIRFEPGPWRYTPGGLV